MKFKLLFFAFKLLQELDGHKGFVNCLCFSRNGKTMFSGDSTGVIIMWNASVMVRAATSGEIRPVL